jgi:hypothetical protein
MTPAADLDWSRIARFSPQEWPARVLERMDGRLINVVSDVRNRLPRDHSMTPSPLARAHVREHGGSRHSTNAGARLSDATDLFMQWHTVWAAWRECLREPRIGGLGLYVDSYMGDPDRTRPMLHIDLRPERVMWVCWRVHETADQTYTYHHLDPTTFHRVLAERGRERRRGVAA